MEGYLGTIMMCGFNFAPRNYAFCGGATLPISQNTALYSLLGSQFGGDDRTTFNLPNLSAGRVPGGQGTYPGLSTKMIGQHYGRENSTLSVQNLPSHNHGVGELKPGQTLAIATEAVLQANKSGADATTPENNYSAPAVSGLTKFNSYATTPDTTMNSGAIDIRTTGTINVSNLTTAPTGQGVPVPIEQPTLILNFVICINGLFPTRS